jgi:3-methyladenine DNA glycosylase AlkD
MSISQEYVQALRVLFQAAGNPEVAQGQIRYMKHQFEFFGLKAPVWMAITKQYFEMHGCPEGDHLEAVVRLCYADDHREMQYFGLECVQKRLKKAAATEIEFLEWLICNKSWWDTVDWIAKLVGIHFRRYPELIKPVTERWMASGNRWLQRVSMIFQLTYREKTDSELLFKYVRELAGSKEFFIQKGAGWALRQYSRTAPALVRAFIQETPQLSALTRREGMRLMMNEE